jgi:hypothetical protein
MNVKRDDDNMSLVSSKFRIIDLNTKINLPLFRETGYREWIDYGDDNLFPQFLQDVYIMKSITQKTIINRKQKMIAGEGWKKPTSPELMRFWKNSFSDDTLDEILIKVAYDLEINAGFALNIIWSQDGNSIAQIEHIPFETVRVDKNNGKSGEPDYYWVSDDWSNTRKYKPVKKQAYSKKYKQEKSQILYKAEYIPGSRMFYPIPTYYSSINWILSEWEISNFHRSTIQSGFNAGFILNFATGVPSPEEIETAYREIQNKYTGTWNAGKFILTFSNGQDEAPKLEPIPLADTDARYTSLNDLIRSNIFVANEVVNPEIFGISVPGQLGGKQQMVEGLEIFQAVYINYKQKLIEDCFNKLKDANGIVENLVINKYEIDKQKIVTTNEGL